MSASVDAKKLSSRSVILVSALSGALLMGALWVSLGGTTRVRVATERVALIPVESVAPRVTPAEEWSRAVTEIAQPSTASVRLADDPTIVAAAFAIRDGGYLVTSTSALDDANTVIVVMSSGQTSTATVVGSDHATDLTVLKIDGKIAAVVVSDRDGPATGDSVAVVAPRGAPETKIVTELAATSSTSKGYLLVGVIALDGTIGTVLPGSPAVDTTGAVVGMIVSTASDAPAAVMPIGLARSMVNDLITNGRMSHPKAGITARDIQASDHTTLTAGAFVVLVEPNGPAADSGMLVGDIVVDVDGNPVTTMAAMVAEIMKHRPGDRVDFVVMRGAKSVVCRVALRESDSAG